MGDGLPMAALLFAARRLNREDVRLLAAAVDGSGLWAVTIPFACTACNHGRVIVPTWRTQFELLQVVPAQAVADGKR